MPKKKKGDDPWDDTALIDALDRALSTYKDFHGIKDAGTTSNTEGFVDAERITSACTETTEESKSHSMSDTQGELCFTHADNVDHDDSPCVQENQPGEESSHPEQISGAPIYDNTEGYDPTGYYQLLHQYYELEEQRIKILQQLCQANHWNHQMPCQYSTYHANHGSYSSSVGGNPLESDQFGNGYSSQPQVGMTPCNYCGYYSSCAPWNFTWAASQPAPNGGRKVSDIASDNTKAVLQAVVADTERAISSLKLEAPSGSTSCENVEEKRETQGTNASSLAQNFSPETDLSQVLGAWYSAGFYTGRYTMEQSLKRD